MSDDELIPPQVLKLTESYGTGKRRASQSPVHCDDGNYDDGGDVRDEPFAVTEDGEEIKVQEGLTRRLPRELLRIRYYCGSVADWQLPEEQRPQRAVADWDKIADRADLDEGERNILKLRAVGYTREQILKRGKTEQERKDLQAAWRRLDRSWPRLASVVTGKKENSV